MHIFLSINGIDSTEESEIIHILPWKTEVRSPKYKLNKTQSSIEIKYILMICHLAKLMPFILYIDLKTRIDPHSISVETKSIFMDRWKSKADIWEVNCQSFTPNC